MFHRGTSEDDVSVIEVSGKSMRIDLYIGVVDYLIDRLTDGSCSFIIKNCSASYPISVYCFHYFRFDNLRFPISSNSNHTELRDRWTIVRYSPANSTPWIASTNSSGKSASRWLTPQTAKKAPRLAKKGGSISWSCFHKP